MAAISSITPFVVNLSPKSNWFFVRVSNDAGIHGYGEGTLYGRETEQLAALEAMKSMVVGRDAQQLHVGVPPNGGLVASSVVSALEQAINDVRARELGVPIYKNLGSPWQRTAIRMYANINRRTEDRSPEGFAASARDALEQGFLAIKIAPFDGVVPQELGTPESRALIDAGIARIHATREAIGAHTVLMVDCHWRFDAKTAAAVLKELKSAKLFWFECPIAETEDNYAALKKLRRTAHRIETRLAGAEQAIGVEGFKPYVEGGLYDVAMPDVKYVGGYYEMLRIAELCQRNKVDFAPHNPTGPVCTMASLHVSAVAPNFLLLEHQLGESPLYHELVRGAHPQVRDGCFEVPNVPGLGIDLDEDLMRAHPYQPLTNVRDARLGQGGR